MHKGKEHFLYSYRHSSSNIWKGLPVKLISHSAGHSDEALTDDETWHLPEVQSVSNNTYSYHNAKIRESNVATLSVVLRILICPLGYTVLPRLAWAKLLVPVFGRLMLMALYNISISVKGLKYISESPEIIPAIWTLLEGKKSLIKRCNHQWMPHCTSICQCITKKQQRNS